MLHRANSKARPDTRTKRTRVGKCMCAALGKLQSPAGGATTVGRVNPAEDLVWGPRLLGRRCALKAETCSDMGRSSSAVCDARADLSDRLKASNSGFARSEAKKTDESPECLFDMHVVLGRHINPIGARPVVEEARLLQTAAASKPQART